MFAKPRHFTAVYGHTVVTKTRNYPKRPKMTQNDPKRSTTTPKPPKTIQNHPPRPTTERPKTTLSLLSNLGPRALRLSKHRVIYSFRRRGEGTRKRQIIEMTPWGSVTAGDEMLRLNLRNLEVGLGEKTDPINAIPHTFTCSR